jgi:hypothetical protein
MLSFHAKGPRLCDGLSRREWLRVGGLGAFALSMTGWQECLSVQAATSNSESRRGKAKACIVLFLMGGPAQHSTWDPKPDAPKEIRGEFKPIATSVPGVQICELLPRTAKLAHKISILRAVSTGDNAHSSSGYAMLTGTPHQPLNVENANPGAPNDWPTLGAVVQHLRRGTGAMPAAVRLPHHIFNTDSSVWPGQDSGFLGRSADPWLFRCEPAAPNFQAPGVSLTAEVPAERLDGRRSLLNQLDQHFAKVEGSGALESYDQRRVKAFDLLRSPRSRSAFDLNKEPDAVRDRYGRGQFGQSVLLSRRLIEAGVLLVQVNWFRGADEPSDNPCWDSHVKESERLKTVLAPPADQAYSALLEDLDQRGMLDETLVVCMSEFGRSPKMNPSGGREHWGNVFSVTLAGGGVHGGVVHGASDKHGGFPRDGRVLPQDLSATIFHCLGLDPETEIHNALGKPAPLSRGQVIDAVL